MKRTVTQPEPAVSNVPGVVATGATFAAGQWWLLPASGQTWADVWDPSDLAALGLVWLVFAGAVHLVMTGPRWGVEKLLIAAIVVMLAAGLGWELVDLSVQATTR